MGGTGTQHEAGTDFLMPERASPAELAQSVSEISHHPATDALLSAFGGVLVILNEQRQIVALNPRLLELVGVADPLSLIGLRPGESLKCEFFEEAPGGCGTGKMCRTCGAAIAIVSSQDSGQPSECECLLSRRIDGHDQSLELRVRATPLVAEGGNYTVVTLQEIGLEKSCQALQHAFLHDIRNLAASLRFATDELRDASPPELHEIVDRVEAVANGLVEEAESQRALFEFESGAFEVVRQPVTLAQICFEAHGSVSAQAEQHEVELGGAERIPEATVYTEPRLVNRVLSNMLLNAIEATRPGGRVLFRCVLDGEEVVFRVWNSTHIPEEILRRVFQRFFTTKGGIGRGIGAYSMKLIGERYLGGRASIQSSEAGTVADLRLPLEG